MEAQTTYPSRVYHFNSLFLANLSLIAWMRFRLRQVAIGKSNLLDITEFLRALESMPISA
jgi:hypothetical protein